MKQANKTIIQKHKLIVLSLFDGISCGQIALHKAGIEFEKYYASEINSDAIKITQSNYPNTIQLGDIKNITTELIETISPDLIIGGSPCTNWSCAKIHTAKVKKENYINEGEGWELFKQYIRVLNTAKPKYFLYENNYRIPENIKNNITEMLGVEPIMIDSALVSAQRRKRLYWTNIPNIIQPIDKGIVLKDIYVPDKSLEREDKRILDTAVFKKNYIQYAVNNKHSTSQAFRLYYLDGKAPTQARCRTESKSNILIDKNNISKYKIISPLECERLQTLPDGYTDVGLPKTKRFECIGNGWTVDVIAHIFSFMKGDCNYE